MIPLLTLMADFMGVIGGAVVSTQILNVDSFAYWKHSRDFVDGLDIFAGVFKSFFFGAAIALISCHRGFNSKAGAEGVGRAATEAFVFSFIAILFLDFVIGLGWNSVYHAIWPQARDCYEPDGAAPPAARSRRPDRALRREHAVPPAVASCATSTWIRRGQTVCIIGESGCGKTVMLKLIIGLLQPTQGGRQVRRPQTSPGSTARS